MKNNVEDIPKVNMDFSKLDSLLNDLKTNINNFQLERMEHVKQEIEIQIENLKGLSIQARKNHAPNVLKLLHAFMALYDVRGFSDVKPVVNSLIETIDKDFHSPSQDLLKSDPEKY